MAPATKTTASNSEVFWHLGVSDGAIAGEPTTPMAAESCRYQRTKPKQNPKSDMKTRVNSTALLRHLPALLLMGSALLCVSPSNVEAGVFAKLEGYDGQSADANHDKWIDVLSIDWGAHKPSGGATGQSRRRGGVIVEDLTLVMEYEKSSPKLQEACSHGKIIPKLEIDVVSDRDSSAGENSYLTYKLKDVIITSYSVVVAEDGTAALQIAVKFSALTQTHTDGDGNETVLEVDKRGRSKLTDEPTSAGGSSRP